MKLYVWGTGRITGKILETLVNPTDVEGFVDNDISKSSYMGKKVYRPEEFVKMDFDALIIATLRSREIREQCEKLKINGGKIIYLYNNVSMEDFNRDYSFVERILGKKSAELIRSRNHVIRESDGIHQFNWGILAESTCFSDDYVRIKTFEYVTREIQKKSLKGNIAEAGVYKGEFAQFINYAFPDRQLYLFDTFSGFREEEAEAEQDQGNCTRAFVQAYNNPDIELVMKKMTYPQNVIIKKGLFPESARDIESDFAFVSLDMDFEESIYAGLVYFYPRLVDGGYIFVHDYNSALLGVERAVERYEEKIQKTLCKVPICDANGTLIITKQS